MKIKLGATVYPSQLGHNGFYYPIKTEPLKVTGTLEASTLPWVGGQEMIAVKPNSTLSALNKDDEYVHIDGPVWIPRN